MTEQELKDYAEHLVFEHAREVEYLSVFEMYDEYVGECDASISDDDAKKVLDLVGTATIEVSWPEPKTAA